MKTLRNHVLIDCSTSHLELVEFFKVRICCSADLDPELSATFYTLPVLAKLLERIIAKHLYLNLHGLMPRLHTVGVSHVSFNR